MFCISSMKDIDRFLSDVYSRRLSNAVAAERGEVRGPVGLFLVREDGAAGSRLARQVVSSFAYWHTRTGHFFDALFLGWGFNGGPAFVPTSFSACVSELERDLSWSYRGGAALLFADFVYAPAERRGSVDFSRTVAIEISDLLEDQKIRQLGPLLEELTAPSRLLREGNAEAEISEYVALLGARRYLWKTLLEKMGTLLGWVDDVLPHAARDLRKGA